jgi:membrane protein required for colicin V production
MITVLDVIVIVVVLISAILAMVRGFVREVLSVASWVAAAVAAYFFYKPVVPFIQPYLESATVAIIVSAAAVFFVALIVVSYIAMKISDFVIDSRIGALDRVLGFVFGAVRGVLMVVVALIFFNWMVARPPTWVTAAYSKPILDRLGEQLKDAMPADLEAMIQSRIRGVDTGGTGEPGAPPDSGEAPPAEGEEAPPPDEAGTSATDRQRLDQIIENSDGAGETVPQGETPGD